MAKDFSRMEDSNRSSNRSIHDVSSPSRRLLLQGGAGAAVASFFAPFGGAAAVATAGGAVVLGGCATAPSGNAGARLGFAAVPVSTADAVAVPPGYVAEAFAAWGEPVGIAGNMPAFKPDGGNTAAEQAAQMGMHHDGMHFYAAPGSTTRGLLVTNHEYVDDGLLHAGGLADWSAEKVAKAQAAHGVSVIEIARGEGGGWDMVRPSPYARRITAATPMAFAGPAAGHAMLRTAADPQGLAPIGTVNNCASGITPWGTYLTSEENFANYFRGGDDASSHEKRWGLRPVKDATYYRWDEHDARFDARRHPNEPNRFGWVVEIDPWDATSTPVKRTALGRAAREGATVAVTTDSRAVVYSGEDARFEYIYKFVSRDAIRPGGAKANASLLDHGTLYVARFDEGGRGRWMPLVHGSGPLDAGKGFADQGEVLIKSRQASDALGATKMDRPEWIAVDAKAGWVYCTLTNNSSRGADGFPGVDAANPRANNVMGHIIRWKEDGGFAGETFAWNHFVMAGDPAQSRAEAKGDAKGDIFGCPDGLWVDPRGTLWVQTDMSTTVMGKGEHAGLGNNAMLAADTETGEVRRFLVGPVGCEITGCTMTPDGRTMFVNIQHPGETPSERSDPAQPRRWSNWPDRDPNGRPRSATVVIRKIDGGLIGS